MGTHFDWDEVEDNIVAELDDDGNTVVEYTTEPTRFGNVISQYRNGQTSYFHHDGIGNTVAVTNDNGDVTDTRTYNAFGETTESTGTTEFPFQFGGQKGYYRDEETGEYSVRARPYEPLTARWKSIDPLGLNADINFFVYVSNNPVTHLDPSGKQMVNANGHWYGSSNLDECEFRLSSFSTIWKVGGHRCAAALLDRFLGNKAIAKRMEDNCPSECKEELKNSKIATKLPIPCLESAVLPFSVDCNAKIGWFKFSLSGAHYFLGPKYSLHNETDLHLAFGSVNWVATGDCGWEVKRYGGKQPDCCSCYFYYSCRYVTSIPETYDFCSSNPAGLSKFEPLACACALEKSKRGKVFKHRCRFVSKFSNLIQAKCGPEPAPHQKCAPTQSTISSTGPTPVPPPPFPPLSF